MAFGLDENGLSIPTLQQILDEIENEELNEIDNNLDLSSTSVLGQLNGIFAERERLIWELLEDVYAASYPDTASELALDYLSSITGTLRKKATRAKLQVNCTLQAGTVLPAGSTVIKDNEERMKFELIDEFENDTGSTDTFLLDFQAVEKGSYISIESTDTIVIDSPVSGWTAVDNPEDSVDGQDTETDSELRIRREIELAQAGTSTLDAIRADVLDVSGVQKVTVFENTSDTTDAEGIPPHSIETLVTDDGSPTDAQIAQSIWDTKPAGINAHGDVSAQVTDDAGVSHTISFSRPTDVELHVRTTIEVVSSDYVGDSATQTALKDFGTEHFGLGDDVYSSNFYPTLLDLEGVENVVSVEVTVGGGVWKSVETLGARDQAVFDTPRITVTSNTL